MNGDFKVKYPDNTKKYGMLEEIALEAALDLNERAKNFTSAPTTTKTKPMKKVYADMVQEPEHYKIFPDTEVIDIIEKSLTAEEFRGYCKGNIIKYRLRDKHDIQEDFEKSKKYKSYLQSSFDF